MCHTLNFAPKGRCIPAGKSHMPYIDAVYFLGLILVVWGHSHPLDSSWWGSWYSDLNGFIYTFHMPLYFFIGGYLLVHSHSIDQSEYKAWAKEKLLKFLVPYIVLTFLAYVPKAMLGDTTDVVELSLGYLLKTTFLVPRIGVWGHFWFIPTFLVLDLLWGVWRAKAPKNPTVYRRGLLIGGAVSLLLAVFPIHTDCFVLYDLSQEAVFYACGILLALVRPVLWDKTWKHLTGITVGSFCAYLLYPYGNYMNRSIPAINFVVGLALVWVCWCVAQFLSKLRWDILVKLTKYSFNIFVYSWPAQAALDALLRRLGVNWLVIIAILFVAGFVCPLLIIAVYKRMCFLHCRFFDYLIGVKTVATRKEPIHS